MTAARRLLQDSGCALKLQRDWSQLEPAAVARECCALAAIDVEQHHGRILKCELLFIIAVCNKTIVALIFFVLFNQRRPLVIVFSPSIVHWPLKKSDYPLVAPRVFCEVNSGNRRPVLVSFLIGTI